MKNILKKIIGSIIFAISSIVMFSTPVFAATAQDYEKLGESLSPFLIVGIIALVVWFIKKKK